jgi:hypothetical protein
MYAYPCVSATTGRLWVVYADFAPTENYSYAPTGVVLQYSDDDGATWSSGNTTVVAPIAVTGTFDDPSCVGDGNDVWVEYERQAPGCRTCIGNSINVVHSVDGGRTFGAPVNVLDTSVSYGAWHSTLVREANGGLDVLYYGGGTTWSDPGSVSFVRSRDQGVTWSKATLIKQPITVTSAAFALGDYLGIATGGGALHTTFTDNSSGTKHVGYAKVTLP